MFITFLLLMVASYNFTASCFSCGNLSQESQCLGFEGCSWSGTGCAGVFSPSCIPPACYYIDNSTQTTTPTGTPTDPLYTLTDGFNKLANSDGSLIIMNHRNATLVDITSAITIETNITIKPLILGNYYQINLNKILSTTANSTFTVSKQLTIIEAIFNYTLTKANVLFVMQNGTISLQGVIMQVSLTTITNLLTVRAGYPSSKFYYEGGQISMQSTEYTPSDKSTSFYFASGFGSFKNVKVIAFVMYFARVDSNSTLTVEECYFRGGTGSIFGSGAIFNVREGNLSISRSVFEQGNSALFYGIASTIVGITIQQSIFRDVITNAFIFTGNPAENAIDSPIFFTIRDCLFENITATSIFTSTRMNAQIALINVTMNNIKRLYYPPFSINPSFIILRNELDSGLGVCCYVSTNGTLNIISSSFANINYTCIAAYDSTSLNVTSSVFNNSGIDVEESSLSRDSLKNLEATSGVTWIYLKEPSYSTIDSSKFIRNIKIPIQGGAIRVIGSKRVQLSLTSNEFIENIAYYGGAVYINNPLLRLISTKNIFTSNSAYDGGAVYKKSTALLKNPFMPSLIIEDDNYTGNIAIRAGGAAYINGDSLQISQGQFVNNSARFGGGLYAINIDTQNTDMAWLLSGTTFTDNVASDVGSCVFSLSNLKEDQCIFENNIDPLNQPVIAQRPSYFLFSFYDVIIDKEISGTDDLSAWATNTSRTKLAFTLNTSQTLSNKPKIKQKSGTEIKQIIQIEAYDEQGHILRCLGKDNQILARITETKDNIASFKAYVKSSPLISTFKEGKIFLKTSLKIFGETNSKATLNFKNLNADSNPFSEVNFALDQDIEISFVPCEVGDIYYASSKSCNPCPFGTYSLEDPYQSSVCKECVANAECLGGSKISPFPGYWRSGTGTATIMQCLDETACRGGYINEIYYPEGICAPSHEGKLCSKCVSNSAKFGSSEKCFDCLDAQYYIKFFGFFGLYLLGIILSFKYASKKEKASNRTPQDKIMVEQYLANEELRSNILKIVIGFIQMSSVTIQYRFKWPKQASEIVQLTNKIMPIGQDAFSVDCFISLLFGPDAPIHFIKLIVTIVRPFFLWMIILGGHNLYTAIKQKNFKKLCPPLGTNQLVLLLIIAFVDQPHIILIALETFKCQVYENGQSSVAFMVKDSLVECWTTTHIAWSAISGVVFLIWGVILPILLFKKIHQIYKRDKSLKPEDYSIFRYFFGSMKPKFYYWEFISLFRKTLIIIFFSCYSVLSEPTQINLTLMILWCFTGFCGRFKPYKDERLNRLELGSLITLMVLTYTGAFFIDAKTSMANVLIIAMIIIIISFYLLSIYYLVASYLQKPSQTTKDKTVVKTKQVLAVEKEASFISLRSPISSSKAQGIEELLQSIEIEPDDQAKQREPSNIFFAMNSISSEPDSELRKTNHNILTKHDSPQIKKSLGDLRDLEPLSHRDSEYDIMQASHRATTMNLLGSQRNPTTTRENEKDYENIFGPKRSSFLRDLQLMRNREPIAQEMIKLSIPVEHEGITTPKYETKNKRSLSPNKKIPPFN